MVKALMAGSILVAACASTGCTQSLHGSFVASSFVYENGVPRVLGGVEGRSCQDKILYLFPAGDRASTNVAIGDARTKIDGTDVLTDISIDDEVYFGIGYSRRCIVVHATAVDLQER
jgi:hypothetical protein